MSGKELLCKLNSFNSKADEKTSIISEDEYISNTNQNEVMKLILSDIPKEVDITKKQTAIIVHNYLRKVLFEKDETDTSPAKELKDIYDCRICVQHIEQLYCKGIMQPLIDANISKENNLPMIFGGNELLSDIEAEEIVRRVFMPEFRTR